MRAWRTNPQKQPGAVALEVLDRPEPGAGEILVAVRAAALNRGDFLMRNGKPDPRLPSGGAQTLGLECAGVVEKVGEGVSGWKTGDEVMGRCWGGLAEYAIMKAALAMPKPAGLPWEQAATMHVLVVAHDAICTWGRLEAGENVLVNAASSGIGVASIQLARMFGASQILAASTSPDKWERLRPLGATDAINLNDPQWPQTVLAATGGRGADVVPDSVGASLLDGHLACMAIEGRLISIGRMGGARAELDMDRLALRRISLIGVTNRTRTEAEQALMVERFTRDVLPALADGRLTACVDRTFAFEDAEAGWSLLQEGRQIGKLVLVL